MLKYDTNSIIYQKIIMLNAHSSDFTDGKLIIVLCE